MSAPGWYPDPNGQPYQRWWDGTQWTDQTQAQGQPQAQAGYAQQQQQAQQAPGWQQPQQGAYPQAYAQPGVMRPEEARQWAMFAHLSAILLGFIGPLVIYLVKKDEDAFVADQAREALNFQLTVLIGAFICVILAFVIIGFFLIPVLVIGALVFEIIAGVQANKGIWYRYPLNIRMISG
jgi:uncharacterized protein